MNIQQEKKSSITNKQAIFIITTVILSILLIADFMFQGAVYKQLPVSWKNKRSKWIGR